MKLDELAAKQVINDEVIDHFDEDFYGDFYDFFVNFMKFKELTGQMKKDPDEVEFVFYLKNDDDHYGYKLVLYSDEYAPFFRKSFVVHKSTQVTTKPALLNQKGECVFEGYVICPKVEE